MLLTRIEKVGEATGVTFDDATLAAARISEGDQVVITSPKPGLLVLRAITPHDAKALRRAQQQMYKWRDVLRRLGDD